MVGEWPAGILQYLTRDHFVFLFSTQLPVVCPGRQKKILFIGKSQHRGALMKITLDKKVVELKPESPQEAEELDTLWKLIIDCNSTNKKLVAIGDYLPGEKEIARFHIED